MSTSQPSSAMKHLGEVLTPKKSCKEPQSEPTPSLPSERQLASATDFKAVEQSLKSMLPSSVTQALVPKLVDNYSILVGYEITGPISNRDLALAITLLRESLLPCSEDVAMKALYALKVRTASTPAERDIAEERVAVYLADIVDYPADVVVAACRAIANESKWFPAWADLHKELEWRVAGRRKKLQALTERLSA